MSNEPVNEQSESLSSRTIRILTVGDGDLSCSLALERAGREFEAPVHWQITASALLKSREELLSVYPSAESVLSEFSGNVIYGLDATQLHQHSFSFSFEFDYVLFHHPHLGYSHSEQIHRQRHAALLAHYLHSAQHCLTQTSLTSTSTSLDPCIHLCLCGQQSTSWQLHDAMDRLGLELARPPMPTTVPLLPILCGNKSTTTTHDTTTTTTAQSTYKAPRRYRNGKWGSRHWLGKYGYRHQPCFPGQQTQSHVQGSLHYFIRRKKEIAKSVSTELQTDTNPPIVTNNNNNNNNMCWICCQTFDDAQALEKHMQAPALPQQPKAKQLSKSPIEQPEASNLSEVTRKRPSPPQHSLDAVTSQSHEANTQSLYSFTCESQHDGKRLRAYLQQEAKVAAKRKCQQLIGSGTVSVNGTTVLDSSRILHTNDVIVVRLRSPVPTSSSAVSDKPKGLRVVKEVTSLACLVVYKPVGVRSTEASEGKASIVDANHDSSVESWAARKMGMPYRCCTKLDTGTSGLCVLQLKNDAQTMPDLTITQTFVALVHGHANEWTVGDSDHKDFEVSIPLHALRRWKKRQKQEGPSDEDGSPAEIRLLERTSSVDKVDSDAVRRVPALSTIQIRTAACVTGLASVVSYFLRKSGYPVVGDRFAKREYLTLPRSVRNRLKQRLCLQCTEVEIVSSAGSTVKVRLEEWIAEKWSARYWDQHCRKTGTETSP